MNVNEHRRGTRGWIAVGWLIGVMMLIAGPGLGTAAGGAAARLTDYGWSESVTERVESDRWFVLRISGQRAGWMRERVTRTGETVSTSIETVVEMKRGAIGVEIRMFAEFVETPDGEPISMTTTQQLGAIPVTQRFFFEEDRVRVVSEQGGFEQEVERELPEGAWLTPMEAAEYVSARLEAMPDEIVVRSIDPFSGLSPVTIRRTGFEEVSIEVLGRTVPAIRCESVMSELPTLTTIEYLGLDGRAIRSETSLGGIPVEIIAADRDLALAPVDAPELMARTFVDPSRPIRRPRGVTRGRYVLSVPGGVMPDLPETSAQRVERLGEDAVRVVVDVAFPGVAEPDAGEEERFTGRSAMIEPGDPEVVRLAERAARGAGDSVLDRAEALRRFVFRYVRSKSLDVGFATSSEVARTREGDCTEHAVLLAAMLRAEGIPARVASGVLYVDEFAGARRFFGYHMWAQAWIDGPDGPRWIDLDPTLPESVAFDATHLTLAVTSFADDEAGNALVSLVPLLGTLEIDVEEVEYGDGG